MYIHLGEDTVVSSEDIIGIFDLDSTTVSMKTREYLSRAQKEGNVINVSSDLPRSFVVCIDRGKTKVYISQLSTKTLSRRKLSI